ncbi:MAG: aldose 1-epimerase family protein [Kiritimatiellae bacterium]|jgi:hypothetical protein|nr:aldose 1-epimerase family protein [Kiritimatiellia bacterium]HHU13562.1 aldose 1-epimerase family protein [Lentisphaerota bacterium]HON48399.1 aldose 1-epimerase family protein [Kiritimatiellia bacterium]HRT28774.1 aldose 1-epimerase family protein [Kiritimatiellia bacterium]
MKNLNASYLAPRLGTMEQLASIRRLVSDDGKGRGMRILEVNTGSGLIFTVYPDRGMDIGAATFCDIPLAWLSRNGEVGPAFYDRTGIEWLRTWPGGLLTGCGLSNVGGPNASGGDDHGLHGRLSHLPAEAVNTDASWTEDGRYTLSISGRVRQSKVFFENLVLTRRITATLGESAITVCDTIENRGYAEVPLMLLYHMNLGWPLVDDGARLEMPRHKVVPQNDHAASGLAEWAEITAPIPGFAEQVYYHTLPKNRQGLASARLVNENLGLTFCVTYRVAELPYLIQWKMMGQGEYVVGLEPANCFPEGQAQNAERGTLRMIAPGERVETYLRLSVEVHE